MTDLLTPFPYQAQGAAWLATMPQALLADDMGLGKSCQAICAADLVGAGRILVICPAVARVNWEREFERFSPMDHRCTVLYQLADKVPPAGVVICSYEWATANAHLLKAQRWDLLVIDEAHYLKERTAKRTKAIYGRGTKFPGIVASAARTWRLTGTPAPNYADELWTHLKSMGAINEDYWDFTFRYCSGFQGDFGYRISGHKNTQELKALMAPWMLRRKKEDVLKELPDIRFNIVTVEKSEVHIDPYFYENYRDIGAEQFYKNIQVADRTLQSALQATIRTKNPAADSVVALEALGPALSTLRRYVGLAKAPKVIEMIKEELETRAVDKIVIFAVHQQVIEMTRLALAKFGAVTLYGGTPAEKRQANIDKFMTDPGCRVFIGNIQASGTAINLTSAHEVAFIEQDWVPANNAQAVMRCHRIGQKRRVRVRVFALHKSVDERVQEVLTHKSREMTKIF